MIMESNPRSPHLTPHHPTIETQWGFGNNVRFYLEDRIYLPQFLSQVTSASVEQSLKPS